MKRKGLYRPTLEDALEISGIESLHPGGLALTRRTGEVTRLRSGLRLLDVSSGQGTQAVLYAREFGVDVTGIDLSSEMVAAARRRARAGGMEGRVRFERADSQELPFDDASFDAAINECAVGIPDDSQKVLDEMVRVLRPGGSIAIHESTWLRALAEPEKEELAERYGTTPLSHDEWSAMLERAGAHEVRSELDPWSAPENFWKIRQDRDVSGPGKVLSLPERARTVWRVATRHGFRGVATVLQNERVFYRAVRDGKIGYGLYWGRRPTT